MHQGWNTLGICGCSIFIFQLGAVQRSLPTPFPFLLLPAQIQPLVCFHLKHVQGCIQAGKISIGEIVKQGNV